MFSLKRKKNIYYGGLLENTSFGLHAKSFTLFRKHAPPPVKVLDLGGGSGAWSKRLHDASYSVTFCDINPQGSPEFPYRQLDLNQDFADQFPNQWFDAVCLVEIIEHLENPRHTFRQLRPLLRKDGLVLLTTPNASGLYSRVRFFFTGQMAMFTDADYGVGGHITPMTAWQLEKVFSENGFTIVERGFHDAPFFPPRSLGDFAKIFSWVFFRPFMFGTVGGQNILYILRKDKK
jgi:2-polyprenyl-3-methyl-5-hydroxy-6-metoxy-1,4-benzoquinol methylase